MPRRPSIIVNDSRIGGGNFFIYTPKTYSKKEKKWVYANMFSVKRILKLGRSK